MDRCGLQSINTCHIGISAWASEIHLLIPPSLCLQWQNLALQLQRIGTSPADAARMDVGLGKSSSSRKGRTPLSTGKAVAATSVDSPSVASGLRFVLNLLFGIGPPTAVAPPATPMVEEPSDDSSSTSSGSEEDAPAGTPSYCTRQYDRKLLSEKTAHLRRVRAGGNVKEMMFALRLDLVRNIANIAKRWVPGAGRRKWPARFSCPSGRLPQTLCTVHIIRLGSSSRSSAGVYTLLCVFPSSRDHVFKANLPPCPPAPLSLCPSSKLYEQFPTIPGPIQEYLQEVKEQLVQVCVLAFPTLFTSPRFHTPHVCPSPCCSAVSAHRSATHTCRSWGTWTSCPSSARSATPLGAPRCCSVVVAASAPSTW